MIFVTGGCGFIGSNFVLEWLKCNNEPILIIDDLTYAGNIHNLDSIRYNPLLIFIKGNITDQSMLETLFNQHRPRAILNFAAESHVDRSINNPHQFITTNINGTFCLLEVTRYYWNKLNPQEKNQFRFLQVSTDEIYGSLKPHEAPFTEDRAYNPNNPYSASKAGADHLVNAYHHTYQLPTIITNCSNNYGPYQFPEKLIPLTIINALQTKPLFIYGDGLQIRDWLYVTDHCSALRTVLSKGLPGETYNIGGCNEKTNLEVVHTICNILSKLKPYDYLSLITHIKDRPGHDRRYAINANKIKETLNWKPNENFESGIRKTILWYLDNLSWTETIHKNNDYREWLELNYENRGIL